MRFDELKLSENILKAVKQAGYLEPTPIQEKCIPIVQSGKDMVAQSSTGSGKTAVFGLPILEKIVPGKGIQLLVLTPTRELCVQVKEALSLFAKYLKVRVISVYGGVGFNPQVDAIRTADALVGTPGRVLDHLRQKTLSFGKVKWVVLDEGDKMLEMGFIEDVETIINHVPRERQTLLFSATFPSEIHGLVDKYLKLPIVVKTDVYVSKSKLRQVYYNVSSRDKFSLLVYLLMNKTSGLALVFCGTRNQVELVTKNLKIQKVNAMAIHGGLAQNKRLKALELLKKKNIDVLVATDVAARGLDIKYVSHIYNYDVPKTSHEYIHRIGRTARAGEEGDAVVLLTERDFENFSKVLEDRSLEIKKLALPAFRRVYFVTKLSDKSGRDNMRGGGFRGNREAGREIMISGGFGEKPRPISELRDSRPRHFEKRRFR